MSKSKNDEAWEKLFDKHKILQTVEAEGHVSIRSTDINEFREARLMTKFDHRSQLPKLFTDNGLSILPTSRGGYVIGAFETFHRFDSDTVELVRHPFPNHLESLDYRDITSEATAINCAFVSGILHDFTAEIDLSPTVSGRMSSSEFEFFVNTKRDKFSVKVDNAQIEIDGGYEGAKSLNLIEAKNYLSDDFLVRQLFYPFKLWKDKIGKEIRTIFLTYTNGVFHLREYKFLQPDHYNSLQLARQKKYTFEHESISIETVQKILQEIKTVEEPQTVPFPQADHFEKVINLCELLKQRGALTKEEITENYDFVARQTDYYLNAATYLGLAIAVDDNEQSICRLTEKGQRIFTLPIIDRQLEFIKLIASHTAFKKALEIYLKKRQPPSKSEIVAVMKQSNLLKINSESTFERRASTVQNWVGWVVGLTQQLNFGGQNLLF